MMVRKYTSKDWERYRVTVPEDKDNPSLEQQREQTLDKLDNADLEADQLIFGTTSAGVTNTARRLLFEKLRRGEPFLIFDPQGYYVEMSRRKAKKRLTAAGLRPAEANAIVRRLVRKLGVSLTLRGSMRHKRRSSEKWFPSDTVIR
jgi:DNA helicase HerA-like ATPase